MKPFRNWRTLRYLMVGAFAFTLILVVAYARLFVPFLERSWGNSEITVYGRIIDEQGHPVPEARVKYRITYSDGAVQPGMFGRSERFKIVTTSTDANGDYCLSNVYGYFVNLAGVDVNGVELESAMGIPCPVETGWSLDDRSQYQTMPKTPAKRITYSFSRPARQQ